MRVIHVTGPVAAGKSTAIRKAGVFRGIVWDAAVHRSPRRVFRSRVAFKSPAGVSSSLQTFLHRARGTVVVESSGMNKTVNAILSNCKDLVNVRILPSEESHLEMAGQRGIRPAQVAGFRAVWRQKTTGCPAVPPLRAVGVIREAMV